MPCFTPLRPNVLKISSLSSNLRQYRKIFGISQAKLSEETAISLARVKAYENENSGQFITNEDLDKLCERFETKRELLLGQSATVETMQDMMKSNCLQEIETALKLLNPIGLQKAAERIVEIAELPRYRLCSLYASVQAIENSSFLPHGAVYGLQAYSNRMVILSYTKRDKRKIHR